MREVYRVSRTWRAPGPRDQFSKSSAKIASLCNTVCGVSANILRPSAISPKLLVPQHDTPPLTTAHVCEPAAPIAVTPDVSPSAAVGVATLAVPVPSALVVFSPQQNAA